MGLKQRRQQQPQQPHQKPHLSSFRMNNRKTTTTSRFQDDPTSETSSAALAARMDVADGLFRHDNTTNNPLAAGRLLLLLMLWLTHLLFLMGQLAPMWQLILTYQYDVQLKAGFLAGAALKSVGMDAEYHFTNYDHHSNSNATTNTTTTTATHLPLRTFTYGQAVHEFWLLGTPSARICAIVLIICSGLWPHLKLLGLQYLVWRGGSTTSTAMTQTAAWLSAAGKWSLADIWAVCLTYAALHWHFDLPVEGLKGFYSILVQYILTISDPDDYHGFCRMLTASFGGGQAASEQCTRVLEAAMDNAMVKPLLPKVFDDDYIAMTGTGVTADLHVQAWRGVHYFCVAVLLSMGVGSYIWHALEQQQHHHHHHYHYATALSSMGQQQQHRSSSTVRTWLQRLWCLGALLIVPMALSRPLVEPTAGGVVPVLFQTIAKRRSDTLHSLLSTTPQASYSVATLWHALEDEPLLVATFGLVLIVGPVLRVLVAVGQLGWRRLDRLGAWLQPLFAWEVLAVALIMVRLLLPASSSSLFRTPLCRLLAPLVMDDPQQQQQQQQQQQHCFQVEMNVPDSGFAWILIGSAWFLTWHWIFGSHHTNSDHKNNSKGKSGSDDGDALYRDDLQANNSHDLELTEMQAVMEMT